MSNGILDMEICENKKNTLSRATLDPRYPDVMEYVKDAFPRIFITALSFSF